MLDSLFPARVIYSITAGIRTHIWAYLYEHFSLDQASERSWGDSSPLALSPRHAVLSQPADGLPPELSQARKCAPGAELTHSHHPLAFVPHGQSTAHLNQSLSPQRREFGSPVLSTGRSALQIRCRWAARLARVDAATHHVPHAPTTKQAVTAASATSPHVCCTSVQWTSLWYGFGGGCSGWGFFNFYQGILKLELRFSVIKCNFIERICCIYLPWWVRVSSYHDLSVL